MKNDEYKCANHRFAWDPHWGISQSWCECVSNRHETEYSMDLFDSMKEIFAKSLVSEWNSRIALSMLKPRYIVPDHATLSFFLRSYCISLFLILISHTILFSILISPTRRCSIYPFLPQSTVYFVYQLETGVSDFQKLNNRLFAIIPRQSQVKGVRLVRSRMNAAIGVSFPKGGISRKYISDCG